MGSGVHVAGRNKVAKNEEPVLILFAFVWRLCIKWARRYKRTIAMQFKNAEMQKERSSPIITFTMTQRNIFLNPAYKKIIYFKIV